MNKVSATVELRYDNSTDSNIFAQRAQFRDAFSRSDFGRFVEDSQISYFVEGIREYHASGATGWIMFNCTEENETLLRLRANETTISFRKS